MRARALFGIALPVFVCAVVAAVVAQTPQNRPSPTPRFAIGVDVVEMDVSVLDKNHKPVRGLTAADFIIHEDGVEQRIVALDEVHNPPPPPPSAPWKRDVPKDVQTNVIQDKQLFVIIVDDAQITPSAAKSPYAKPGADRVYEDLKPPDPQKTGEQRGEDPDPEMKDAAYRLNTMRGVARRAIEMLRDDDLAAVVFTLDNFKGQTFTSDRAKLLKTLNDITLGPHFPAYPRAPESTACQPLWFSTGALRMAVEALSSMPHRRKTVLYVSAGLYIPLIGTPPPEYFHCAPKAQDNILEAFRMAQLANVNVYAIDPSGLQVLQGLRLDQMRDRHNFLLEVAENTGGRAVLDTNDDVGKVAEILDEARSYYVLGYQLAKRAADGKFHRVEVRIRNRPDVEVLARKTRYEADPAAPGKKSADVTAESSVGEFLPKSEIPAEVSVAAFKSATGGTVLLSLGGHLPPLANPVTSDHLDVVVRAFTPDGRDAGTHHELAAIALTPSVTTSGEAPATGPAFDLASRIDLKPGRYSLRIGLRSAATGKAGSVYTDVTVPEFTKDPLALSGVVFTATSGSSRGDVLSVLTPTISREFSTSMRMQAFLRVYQGGPAATADVSIRTRIVDGKNAGVLDHTELLPVQAFARGGQADYFVRLPLSSLKPGEYWLAIEAKAGRASDRRDVRFSVK